MGANPPRARIVAANCIKRYIPYGRVFSYVFHSYLFALDRANTPVSPQCRATPRALPVVTSPSNPASKSVLLVEDNEDNRIIYATALRYAGYSVIEAITGVEGVDRAREHKPDLILMDISVPELDGWEATAILKADRSTKHIPIVAVTAHALPGDEERSLKAGCDGYLAKPISPAALVAEVDRRLGRTTASYKSRS